MKRFFVLIISLLIVLAPLIAFAGDFDSSGETGNPYSGKAVTGPNDASGEVRGIRISFVDKDGKNLSMAPGSYDFLQIKYDASNFYTMKGSNKSKRALITSSESDRKYVKKSLSSYPTINDLFNLYKKYKDDDIKAGTKTVDLLENLKNTPIGSTNTRVTFFQNARGWFLKLTEKIEDREYGRAKYNALALAWAISQKYSSLNYKQLKALLDSSCLDTDVFILMEPIVNVQFYTNGNWDGGIYGSPFEIYYYLEKVRSSGYGRYCDLYANGLLYYHTKIDAMKYFTPTNSCSPSELLTKEGWAMNLDWISPDGNCDCSLDSNGNFYYEKKVIKKADLPSGFSSVPEYAFTAKNKNGAGCCKKMEKDYLEGKLNDNYKAKYAELCFNKCDIDDNGNLYDGNGMVNKKDLPSGISSIYQYAFKSKDEGGLNCCSKFESKYEEYQKAPAKNKNLEKYITPYKNNCLTCKVDASGNIYDKDGKITKAIANSKGFPTIAKYAFSSKSEGGLDCCEVKDVKKAYSAKKFKDAVMKGYDEICTKSCVLNNQGFYFENNLIKTPPSGFSSVPEYAFSKSGANCCSLVDYNSLPTDYKKEYTKSCTCSIDASGNLSTADGLITTAPSGFDSIEEYAFSTSGANCCSSLKTQYDNGTLPISYREKYTELCSTPDPSCCGEQIIPNKLAESDIHNCCYENEISKMREYNMNALFCYDDTLKVNFFRKNCNVDNYKQGNINNFCELYCSERVTIEIPGAITATSGRYFELTKNSKGYTSPYINGYKRCRMLIKYKDWNQQYNSAVDSEVNSYSDFQKNQALYLTYRDNIAYSKAHKNYETTRIECRLDHDRESHCTSKPCCEQDNDGKCMRDNEGRIIYTTCWYSVKHNQKNKSGNCIVEYTLYQSRPEYIRDYTQVYKQSTSDELKILPRPTEHTSFGPAGKTNDFNYNYDCQKQKSILESFPSIVYCEDGIRTAYYNCEIKPSPSEGNKYNAEKDRDNFYASALAAKVGYASATALAESLEKEIDTCDHYFDTTSQYGTRYTGSYATQMYNKFNAKQSFEYTQIYLDDKGTPQEDVQKVDFLNTPGCVIDNHVDTQPPADNSDDEMEYPQYSSLYNSANHIFATTDFRNKPLEYVSGSNGYQGYLHDLYNADKKFTSDARYHVECNWKEGDNKTYSLVPSGVVTPTVTANSQYTIHKKQYRAYLTTLTGDFETKWYLSNIGEKSQFDKPLESGGRTCSGKSPSSDGTLTCMLKIKNRIVEVGGCEPNNITVGNKDSECNVSSNPDYLLFNFKIADPSDPFPNGTTANNGNKYAYNWTDTKAGQDVAKLIVDTAKADKTYAPDNLSYSFVLNTNTIKHIKNYNKSRNNSGGYGDFDLYCNCPSNVQDCNPKQDQICENTSCKECKSNLIDNLAKDLIYYNGISYNLDKGVWKNSKTLGEIRKKNYKWS